MYDLAIRQASIVDGTGAQTYRGTVYVSGDRIVKIERSGKVLHAKESIEGAGKILAPGFIDVHTHDDIALISNPLMEFKTTQGVTTVIVGLCGYSPAPFLPSASIPDEYDILLESHSQTFECFSDYLSAVREARPSVNYMALVGHSTLRLSVMADVDRKATESEILEMSRLLTKSLDAGAIGLSSGLAYSMAAKSSTHELIELCRAMSERGGYYVTHIRNEADGLTEAVNEALAIGKSSAVPVIFSHHKAMCARNHGKTKVSLGLIDAARKQINLALDVYPYCYSSTSLTRLQARRGGRIVIARSETLPDMVGKTLEEVAAQLKVDLLTAVDMLQPAGALYYLMAEEDLQRVLKHDLTMIGSDGLPFDPHPHPRLWGAFPRVLSRYVRDIPVLTLEEAIRRMTGLPAKVFGLRHRGKIAEGYFADIVLFDQNMIRDTATVETPSSPSEGFELVLINGRTCCDQPGRQLAASGFSI